jgi:pimeloyl-ACP methyl ester carboxylesterase
MSGLRIGAVSLRYAIRGSGPGLLVPLCNFPWLDMPFMDDLAAEFTVATVSPRGYQGSTWLPEADRYDNGMVVADLLAVCDEIGFERFSVLGYSLTGAMAAWLARATPRVDAIVAGGFPLLGSYQRVLTGVTRDVAAMSPEAASAVGFDPRAALAFYRELADLRDGALVDEVPCPMFTFWGTEDEILHEFNTEPDLDAALAARGVATQPMADRDHAGAILGFGAIVGRVVEWLERSRLA